MKGQEKQAIVSAKYCAGLSTCSNRDRGIYVNSLWPNDAIFMMATQIWVNIGSGNVLLPDGTKPLPEPMLTYHQQGLVTFTWGQFRNRYLNHQLLKSHWKLLI